MQFSLYGSTAPVSLYGSLKEPPPVHYDSQISLHPFLHRRHGLLCVQISAERQSYNKQEALEESVQGVTSDNASIDVQSPSAASLTLSALNVAPLTLTPLPSSPPLLHAVSSSEAPLPPLVRSELTNEP